jgi:BolA protein
MGQIAQAIRAKLTEGLSPTRLEVVDDSHRHASHSGARPGGESHFNVIVESSAFAGMKRLDRQRLVHQLLAEELAGPVHALSLDLRPPPDAKAASAPGL